MERWVRESDTYTALMAEWDDTVNGHPPDSEPIPPSRELDAANAAAKNYFRHGDAPTAHAWDVASKALLKVLQRGAS
jgi:hypothetical protein